MSNANLETRSAQLGDSINALLARMLGASIRGTLLASASRSSSATTGTIDAANCRAVLIYLNISVASGTGGLRPVVEYQDPISGNWRGLMVLGSAPITAAGLYVFAIGPGLGAVQASSINAGSVAGVPLAGAMRFTVSASDATPYTYSLGIERT